MSEINPYASPGSTGNETDPDARLWGMFAHLSALSGFFIPFGNLIGPFVVWQIKKNTMPFVDDQGREALNFQITVTIAAVVSWILVFVLIGFLLLVLVGLAALVLCIIAGVKANSGERYRYPFALRLIS